MKAINHTINEMKIENNYTMLESSVKINFVVSKQKIKKPGIETSASAQSNACRNAVFKLKCRFGPTCRTGRQARPAKKNYILNIPDIIP